MTTRIRRIRGGVCLWSVAYNGTHDRAQPEGAVAIFEDAANRCYMGGLDGLEKTTIVMNYTPVGTDPEVSLRILKQTVDVVARQPVFGREGAEGAAVKVTETAPRGDP